MTSLLRRVAIFLPLAVLAVTFGPSIVRFADIHYASEEIRDGWGRWHHQEDWAISQPLSAPLDYSWLSPKLRIAHALGDPGGAQSNTLSAMDRSVKLGLNVLEIDLWLDNDGQLRCHHGPDTPPPLNPTECTWAKAFDHAREANAWLILDIKTEFEPTARAVLNALPNASSASRIIFQLYKPEQVAMFATWQKHYPLPGPIVTAYLSHRSLGHIAQNAERIGVRALTLPLHRRPALEKKPPKLHILVHPIQSCDDVRMAAPADGFYVGLLLHSDYAKTAERNKFAKVGIC